VGTTKGLGILHFDPGHPGRGLVTMPTELSRFQDDARSRLTNNKDLQKHSTSCLHEPHIRRSYPTRLSW
jgi:hypothetical protein